VAQRSEQMAERTPSTGARPQSTEQSPRENSRRKIGRAALQDRWSL